MPSGAPCIYKSGPAWHERQSPQAQRYIREARPVYDHPIAGSWLKIGADIYNFLDSRSVKWTSVDPVAFADAGEKTPFFRLLIWIGVKRETLPFEDAVAVAGAIKGILNLAGFPEIEVAFRESEMTYSVGGPKLLPFNPIDRISSFRKPRLASPAPLKTPHYEGTGALYFRLSTDDDRFVLLTAAHVACPPPAYTNTGMSSKKTGQPRKEIVALGNMGYKNATNAMMTTIDNLTDSVAVWGDVITRVGEFVDGEDAAVTEYRQENQREVEKATRAIENLKKFHLEVTKCRADLEERVIGFVLHAEPISDGPNKLTRDWAFIQLYKEMIDWDTFLGNKVYIGTFPISSRSFSLADYYHPTSGNVRLRQAHVPVARGPDGLQVPGRWAPPGLWRREA